MENEFTLSSTRYDIVNKITEALNRAICYKNEDGEWIPLVPNLYTISEQSNGNDSSVSIGDYIATWTVSTSSDMPYGFDYLSLPYKTNDEVTAPIVINDLCIGSRQNYTAIITRKEEASLTEKQWTYEVICTPEILV